MENYQQHRDKMAAASRRRSLSGRDIYPLPPIADISRRLRCRDSLLSFCQEYFAKKFNKEFGKNHLLLIARLENLLKHGGKQAVAMPRGTGKTTIVIAASIWALANGWRKYLVILAANTKESRKILTSIRWAFQNNPILRQDYPEICWPMYKLEGSALLARGQRYLGRPTDITLSADQIKLPNIVGGKASGSMIAAFGIKAAIRGQSTDGVDGSTIRPDFVILDDVQTNDLAKNPDRLQDMEDAINATIEGLAGNGCELSMIMCCTVIEDNDLADRYLDHSRYPQWQGIRGAALDALPTRMDLWREYRSLRFGDPAAANAFYDKNYHDMQQGALVTWPASYPPRKCRDALQYAMNKWCDYERGFWAEMQNQPMRSPEAAILVPAKVIMKRINGLDHGVTPKEAVRITAFVDVHDDLLYYAVSAWTIDFTGYVIDYGTFPEQNRKYFGKSDGGLETMRSVFRQSPEGSLRSGLEFLLRDLSGMEFTVENTEKTKSIDRILVDVAYKPEIVEQTLRLVGNPNILPAHGFYIGAKNKPMAEYKRKPGMLLGHHWLEEPIEKRIFRTIRVDTNYWKSRIHEMLSLMPGEKCSLSFWGHDPGRHRMIADHCVAESVHLVSSGRNEVHEWKEKPNRPDNHLFDCLVGTAVGAAMFNLDIRETVKR